ncbi:glycosyltransferase family 2 protein [Robertmurraya sp.]|uniref:glycosyltransferase family 2 protein n=1 Tax=Robertmurraya sp. TaxID=2837525 RepID=UPI003703F578
MKLITIIIPCFNEENSIAELYTRLNQEISIINNYSFEILFINDGSSDDTLLKIKKLRNNDQRISFVNLSRNYGKEIAMAAGFDYAIGDAAIIMDADLQHPPEIIKEMIYYWEEGYEDIYAKRLKREGESMFKRYTSKAYYRVLQKMTKIPILEDVGDFRLLDRRCIEALKQFRESQRNTKGIYSWIGFRKKEIFFDAPIRKTGKSKWSLVSLIDLAIDGVTSFTILPLRISSILGFFISVLAFIYLLFIVTKTIIFGEIVSGYPSLMVVILFLGGIQLISLGVIGEYLGRVFNETKNRPLYFVEDYKSKKVENRIYEEIPS